MKIVFNPFTGNFDWVNAGTVVGSGTATQVAFWSSSGGLSGNSVFYWDNVNNRLGVGTPSPMTSIHTNGTVTAENGLTLVVSSISQAFNGHLYISNSGFGFNGRDIYVSPSRNLFIQGVDGIFAGSGNFGIGTTTPNEKLVISDNGAAGFEYIPSTGRWYRYNRSTMAYGGIYTEASEHTWSIGGTEHARLSAGGNFGIGNNNPTYKLDVTGDVRIASGSLGVGVAPNATDGRIDAANDIVAYSSSDKRLKVNIKPIEGAIDKVLAINGVEYDWNPKFLDSHGYSGHDIGVIAHEVQEIFPEAVRVGGHGYLMVRYEKLIPLLIQAVKEQQTYIELLMSKYDL